MKNNLQVRRVVTGHDENGKAVVKIDSLIDGKLHDDDAAFALIWTTDSLPADNLDDLDDSQREIGLASPGGSVLRIVDMFPGKSSPMHRTQTLDYGIILEGEIELELDEGQVTRLKAGDIVIQRGTIHAWNNKTDKICRIAFVLTDAKPIKIGEKVLEDVHA